jgi:hypothetical protein
VEGVPVFIGLRSTRKEDLLARRAALQETIRRAELLDRVKTYCDLLRSYNVEHRVIEDYDGFLSWLQRDFTFYRQSIDWNLVEHQDAPDDRSADAVAKWLARVAQCNGGLEQPVTLVWLGGDPGVEMSLGDFIRWREDLIGFECWVIPANRDWVIECASGDWHWGVGRRLHNG